MKKIGMKAAVSFFGAINVLFATWWDWWYTDSRTVLLYLVILTVEFFALSYIIPCVCRIIRGTVRAAKRRMAKQKIQKTYEDVRRDERGYVSYAVLRAILAEGGKK